MPPRPGAGWQPDLAASRIQYRRRAAQYDAELAVFEPWREEAVGLLQLQAGHSVIDVGCGTGLSLARLQQAVGPAGRIVGFDPSPDMLALAGARVAREHWNNVELIEADAKGVALRGQCDAALFHFTHDVLQDPAAIDNVLAHVKPGGAVVACGLQWAPAWLPATNLFVLGAALYSVSSLQGLHRPWQALGARLQGVQVHTATLGGIYVASGRVPARH